MRMVTMFLPFIRRRCNGVLSQRCKRFTLRRNGRWRWIEFFVRSAFPKKEFKQLSKSDKACCLMEWNDQPHSSYWEIREILREADV